MINRTAASDMARAFKLQEKEKYAQQIIDSMSNQEAFEYMKEKLVEDMWGKTNQQCKEFASIWS